MGLGAGERSLAFLFLFIKMKFTKFKQDKGTAGLTILLSVVVMIFMIGLLIGIFMIMSGELSTSTSVLTEDATTNVANETVSVTDAGTNVTYATYHNVVCSSFVVMNGSTAPEIDSGNYTVTNCLVANDTCESEFWDCGSDWSISYTATYDADNTATEVINDTATAIGGAVDWFDIFIVITAMVVLILLTVIIITAIRSSGMIAGMSSGANNVGTA